MSPISYTPLCTNTTRLIGVEGAPGLSKPVESGDPPVPKRYISGILFRQGPFCVPYSDNHPICKLWIHGDTRRNDPFPRHPPAGPPTPRNRPFSVSYSRLTYYNSNNSVRPSIDETEPASGECGRREPFNRERTTHELCALRSPTSGPLVFKPGQPIAGVTGWKLGRGKKRKRGVRPG